jgi:hypothetical protein
MPSKGVADIGGSDGRDSASMHNWQTVLRRVVKTDLLQLGQRSSGTWN